MLKGSWVHLLHFSAEKVYFDLSTQVLSSKELTRFYLGGTLFGHAKQLLSEVFKSIFKALPGILRVSRFLV